MNIEELLKSLRKWLPKCLCDLIEYVINKCKSFTKNRSKKTSDLNRRGNEVDERFDSIKREMSEDCNKATDILQNIVQELRIAQLMKRFDEEVLLEMKLAWKSCQE